MQLLKLSHMYRKQAEIEYNELKKQVETLQLQIEQERKNPTSEYDESIAKQQYFNETLRAQVEFTFFFWVSIFFSFFSICIVFIFI